MQLYAPQLRVFDAWGVWEHVGHAAWRTIVSDWLGTLGDERVRVSVDAVRTIGGDTLRAVTAILTYTAFEPGGRASNTRQNRLSWVLANAEAGWKIVHEHTSVPVACEDGKAMLRRG